MKKILMIAGIFVAGMASAQDANDIIKSYFEATGGYDEWGKIENVKMTATLNQQGLEIPIEIVQLKDGRQYTSFAVQGQTLFQGVFDGETVWNTNMMTMKPEKADAETTANMKLNANDFPIDLYEYDKQGYSAELLGTETIDGTETYKIKLTKEPVTIDGQEVDDVTYYFFDKESGALLMAEQEIKIGPQKGVVSQSTFSDYDEVNGLYFPFSITQGVKGGPSQPLMIESIQTNTEIDENKFAFPE